MEERMGKERNVEETERVSRVIAERMGKRMRKERLARNANGRVELPASRICCRALQAMRRKDTKK